MSGTHTIRMGDKGRIVVPAEVRERYGISAGVPLVLVETDGGLVILTRRQLRDRVQADLGGLDLAAELLDDRRQAAEAAVLQ